jgi:hypothetical protein
VWNKIIQKSLVRMMGDELGNCFLAVRTAKKQKSIKIDKYLLYNRSPFE